MRRGLWTGTLLLMVVVLAPTTARPAVVVAPSTLARYQAAHALLQGGDYAQALATFESLPANFILADYAAFFAAETLLRQGEDLAALVRLRAFPDGHPDSVLIPAALLAAHDTAFRLGRYPDALEDGRRFLTRAPAHPEAGRVLVRLAEARAAQGQVTEAMADLRRRTVEAPASPWGEAAREVLEDLARTSGRPVSPLTVEERLLVAQRLVDATELTAGTRILEELLAEPLEPEVRARVLVKLGPALGRLRRGTDGIDRLQAGLGEAPVTWRPALLAELARLQTRGGQPAAGAAILERLVADYPTAAGVADAWLALARTRQELGQTAAARAAYQQLLAGLAEGSAATAARWELAWLDYRGARLREAALAFRQLADGSPGYRLAGLYWAARSLEASGELPTASALFRDTVSRGPHAYYGLLAARRLKGRPPAPVANGVRLPADPLGPLAPEPHYQKARALWSVGFETHAAVELDTLLREAQPDVERAWGVAFAYAQLGDVARSLRVLRRHFGTTAESGAPGLPSRFWSLYYPLGHEGDIRAAASRAGLDPFFVAAVIREESSYDPRARSWVGAVGLMQLMPDTARDLAPEAQVVLSDPSALWEPPVNIALGAYYLGRLRARFTEPLLAVASYNAGPHRVQRWLETRPLQDVEEWVDQIPFDETRGFVKRVATSWHHYRNLYGSPERPRRGEAEASPAPTGPAQRRAAPRR